MRILWGLYKASFSGSQRQHPAPSARQQPHVRHNGINCNSHASAFTNDNHEGKESNHDPNLTKDGVDSAGDGRDEGANGTSDADADDGRGGVAVVVVLFVLFLRKKEAMMMVDDDDVVVAAALLLLLLLLLSLLLLLLLLLLLVLLVVVLMMMSVEAMRQRPEPHSV